MLYGAIDLHLRRSQIRIIDAEGQVQLERRVDTTVAGLQAVFGAQTPMRVIIESSTDSEWVAQALEGWGHQAIVTDPNYLAMYATRSRRIKTDRRDVAALAEACRLGIYRVAHRVSAAQRRRRQQLRIRRHLVRARTQTINLVRALLRQEGRRLPSGEAHTVTTRLRTLALPRRLAATLAPLSAQLEHLGTQIRQADQWVAREAAASSDVRRLQSVPGVGPTVGLTFHATLDTPVRFGGDAGRATAFVGLVPAEYSSGERQRKGRITKVGSPELRAMLIQASWTVWRSRSAAAQPLRQWVQALAERRGRRIAVVALARRLTRILFAVWRDGTTFQPRSAAVGVAT
jgi:transposase